MASISRSTPALKSFESLDTSQLQPCLSEMLKQIETLHDQVCQTNRDPNSPAFNVTEDPLAKARAAIEVAQNFINQLIQFAIGCQADCDKVFSKATKELDSNQARVLLRLQELLKYVENAVASINSLDVIIGEITNDSQSMVQLHSLDAQIADKSRSIAKYIIGGVLEATAVGTILASAAFAVITLGVGMGVVSAAGLGIGTVSMAMATHKYSQMVEMNEQLKEKYSCISKSASKVQKLIPKLKTTIERMVDKIKKWSQEEVVKNKLEELRSACEKQHPQLVITQKRLAELL